MYMDHFWSRLKFYYHLIETTFGYNSLNLRLRSEWKTVKWSEKRNSSKAHVESTDQNHTLDISFDLKRTVKADVKHGFDVLRTLFSRFVIEKMFWNYASYLSATQASAGGISFGSKKRHIIFRICWWSSIKSCQQQHKSLFLLI